MYIYLYLYQYKNINNLKIFKLHQIYYVVIQKGMLSILEKNGCYFNTCTIFIEGEKINLIKLLLNDK